jgi:eukaryotic-like serine/threonine-protein kinase
MARFDPNPTEGMLELEPGLVIAQKYRLEKLLKRGGMGAVWIATHLGLETTVAIKFMSSRLLDLPTSVEDEDGAKSNPRALTQVRFEREAKAAARIRSTNVVQMLDHGIDQGTPYIVMEYLRGEDLEVRLKRVGRLSLSELLPIVNAIGRALQLAHAEELVHRDLKPENIFLAKEGDEEIPKILDFGVAKAKNAPTETQSPNSRPGNQVVDGATVQGTMVGTPHYMSPEQIQVGGQVDHRSDLWSFGVLIFRALTGKLPFPSLRLLELAMQICREPIPKATAIAPELGPSFDAFFDKALSRDPAKRFQSAREMAAAFQEIAAVIPTTASTSTLSLATNVDLIDKPKPANKTWMFVLGGATFVLLLGGGTLLWLAGSSKDRPAPGAQPPATSAAPASSPANVSPVVAMPSAAPIDSAASPTTVDPAKTTKTTGPSSRPLSTGTGTATNKTKKRNVGY